ncbi:MAG: N-acetyltransferase family protein [Acidobacteriota bacterium]
MTEKPRIDGLNSDDWESVRAIYLEGIATGDATFETDAPSWTAWDSAHLPFCRLVARDGDSIVGWAALSRVSNRAAYAGVAEVSAYVEGSKQGKGIGRLLLEKLIEESEQEGIWTLQAGVFPENKSSIELHKKCGFREVGTREKIGKLNGEWRDVILMEYRTKMV